MVNYYAHFGRFMFWFIILITIWLCLFGGKFQIYLRDPVPQVKELFRVLFQK